jgi:hypothetical protein
VERDEKGEEKEYDTTKTGGRSRERKRERETDRQKRRGRERQYLSRAISRDRRLTNERILIFGASGRE